MKYILSHLNQCRIFIAFLISIFYSTNIFAETVYWPFAVSVEFNKTSEPSKVAVGGKIILMPLNISHEHYVNDIICNRSCSWLNILKTSNGKFYEASRTTDYTVSGAGQSGGIHWSNLSMRQMEAAMEHNGGIYKMSLETASKSCVAIVPGVLGSDPSSIYLPPGMSFDSVCTTPVPTNTSCHFTTDNVDFSFGQISINSSKKNVISKKVDVNCTAEADLEFHSLAVDGSVLLSNGMTSSLAINNKTPGESIHFKSGIQSLLLTEHLAGTASGFGSFEGHDILKITYE